MAPYTPPVVRCQTSALERIRPFNRGASDVPARPLSPPATFPLGSNSFGMERPKIAYSLTASKVTGKKSAGGDLIDTVRTLDPLAGAAPVGSACARRGHGDGRGAGRMVTLTQTGPVGFGVGELFRVFAGPQSRKFDVWLSGREKAESAALTPSAIDASFSSMVG